MKELGEREVRDSKCNEFKTRVYLATLAIKMA